MGRCFFRPNNRLVPALTVNVTPLLDEVLELVSLLELPELSRRSGCFLNLSIKDLDFSAFEGIAARMSSGSARIPGSLSTQDQTIFLSFP